MTTCSSKSAFFLIRKELRSISGKFWTLSFELHQLERQMNILDARGQGQGQGLSQADVKVYRNAQARQWWLEDRLQALSHPLQAYGQPLARGVRAGRQRVSRPGALFLAAVARSRCRVQPVTLRRIQGADRSDPGPAGEVWRLHAGAISDLPRRGVE